MTSERRRPGKGIGSGLRVLVVDDEVSIQKLLRTVLLREGFAVDTAGTLQEAVALSSRTKFDLMIVDKNLPDGSGLDLIRQVPEESADCESLIITAYASLDSAVDAMRFRVFDYIVKPFNRLDDFRDHVRRAVDHLTLRRKNRELNDAVKKSEEWFRLLFELAPDAYYLNDLEGNFIDGNKTAEEITGYRREELVGSNFLELDLLPEEEMPKAAEGLQKNLQGQPAEINGLTLKRKDGSRVVLDIRAYPVTIGNRALVLGIARDITERGRARKEKAALEDQVRQLQKMEAVGRLAGGVAHEINNPLAIILGFAQSLVARIPDDDPLAMPLRSIEREALRCKTLVADLLAFSRKSTDQYEPTSISSLLESLQILVKNQANLSSIDLAVEYPPDLPPIMGDANRLQQTLVNLANNAIDAMPDGGMLTLQASVNGSGILLKVSDTGGGMSPEVKERIFEPFFTTKEVGKGTGLGLSLVFEIVQQHGGTIECDSEPGKGTTFTIRLPVR